MIILFAPAGKFPQREAEVTEQLNAKIKDSFCVRCKSEKWVKFQFDSDGVPAISDACCSDVCAEVTKARGL
ncbi:MAG: hypothetical protein PHW69_04940 [Elusimicrobiaceae bacterium]|nr:hypothetical protein [Elusimicrobiaceae bacterium]